MDEAALAAQEARDMDEALAVSAREAEDAATVWLRYPSTSHNEWPTPLARRRRAAGAPPARRLLRAACIHC